MKYLISVLSIILITSHELKAQDLSPKDLYGTWKVKDFLYLQMIGAELPEDYKDRIAVYHRCLQAVVKIDSTGISVLPGVGQNDLLDPCDSNMFSNPLYLKKKVVISSEPTKYADGSEMIDSNIVHSRFVKRIDPEYHKPTLVLLDTHCRQGFGDYTMKICLFSKNLIVLFTGANAIILKRVI